MPKPKSGATPYLAAAVVLSLAGIGGFVFLFAGNFNIYWLILSPVIVTLYEFPAVYAFRLYRKRRAAEAESGEAEEQTQGPDRS
ncbi:MAG: hypothetical protein IMZ54_13155 [Acidobacteria bacterium]|nr:hypothetical protein [Acidobacteriota bacterium]MBE3124630.1 hypothetical protein [Acidobacteriota bacterium]MBE3131646.1 hypothetical protein [Acidobacteriota bacterium]